MKNKILCFGLVLIFLTSMCGCNAEKADILESSDTYIPELRLAIEAEATTITEQRSQMVKEHICECNGIRYVKLKHSNDLIKTAQSIKEAFRKCHTFFQTNDEEDIEILRTRFQNWRKQK